MAWKRSQFSGTPFMQKFSHERGIQNESGYPLLVLTNTDVRIDR